MEATLLRMLSLLRRTNVFGDNITTSVYSRDRHINQASAEATISRTGSQPGR